MNFEISAVIELSDEEKATLIAWYENDLERNAPYGTSKISFPEEEILISKI